MRLDDLLESETSHDKSVASVDGSMTGRVHDLGTVLSVMRKMNTSLVLSEVLNLVLDEAIAITRSERGFIMLANAGDELESFAGRNSAKESVQAMSFQVSSSVLEDVFRTGESICVENALNDKRFEERRSIMNLELQTILCSPLKTNDRTIGVIYVDSKSIQAVDKAEVLYLFEILAGQAATAINNAQLFEQLNGAYRELGRLNDQIVRFERMASKGEIAAEVSHELRNLIGVVLLNLQVLEKKSGGTLSVEIQEVVNTTVKSARKIQRYSEGLLTQTRDKSNLLPSDLSPVVMEFVQLVQHLPRYKRNDLMTKLDPDLPKVNIDVEQVQQVLLNLVNNAVEAYPAACVRIVTFFDASVNRVVLSVVDDGPGIDPAILSRLFDEKITTKPDGHGYGLTICKQIIEGQGGSISVESEPGSGAMFVMTFPPVEEA